MSLRVDDERPRRSRSPGRRERSRSRSPAVVPTTAPDESRESSYAYPEDDLDERDRWALARRVPGDAGSSPYGAPAPYPEDEGIFPQSQSMNYDGYDDRRTSKYGKPPSPGADSRYYRGSREQIPSQMHPEDYRASKDRFSTSDDPRARAADPRDSRREASRRDHDPPVSSPGAGAGSYDDDKFKFLPAKYSRGSTTTNKRPDVREQEDPPLPQRERGDSDRENRRSKQTLGGEDRLDKRAARPLSPRPGSPPKYKYAEPKPFEYAEVDERAARYGYDRREEDLAYGSAPYDRAPYEDYGGRNDASPNPTARYSRRDASPGPGPGPDRETAPRQRRQYYPDDPKASSSNVLTAEPGNDRRGSRRERSRSPQPPTQRMSSLSVAAAAPAAATLAAAPGSPLLESYHGTYQDMSPMPSPMLLPSGGSGPAPNVLEPISPIASDDERAGGRRRRARFHDSEDVTERIANALKGSKKDSPPDTQPLIEILPGLSHEQIMDLRRDYKALVKTGADRKGVNVAKHVRSRLKDSDPNLMKACYAVALGRWESEAYWANFWYQGDKTRRELLIESLMGRSNQEIRNIKEAFSDKKYDNSLIKCMKTELKEDKFKKAVLMVLDERRDEQHLDSYGRPLPLDLRQVDQDVDQLRRAVKSEKGGESAMMAIVVQRSDDHLREVLRTYEKDFNSNFARDSLKKSGNLVVGAKPPFSPPLPQVIPSPSLQTWHWGIR